MATVFIFGQMWILIIWTVNPSHMAESLFSSLLLIGGYRKFGISFQWNLASTETVAYTRLAPPHVKKKRFPSCAAIQFGQFYISSQWDPSSTDTIADTGLAPPFLSCTTMQVGPPLNICSREIADDRCLVLNTWTLWSNQNAKWGGFGKGRFWCQNSCSDSSPIITSSILLDSKRKFFYSFVYNRANTSGSVLRTWLWKRAVRFLP